MKNKSSKNLVCALIVCLLLCSSFLFLVNFASATASICEYYNSGDNSASNIQGNLWRAQTFTVNETAHTITVVKLKLYRDSGTVGTLTVSLRATDGSGHPTGSDLV